MFVGGAWARRCRGATTSACGRRTKGCSDCGCGRNTSRAARVTYSSANLWQLTGLNFLVHKGCQSWDWFDFMFSCFPCPCPAEGCSGQHKDVVGSSSLSTPVFVFSEECDCASYVTARLSHATGSNKLNESLNMETWPTRLPTLAASRFAPIGLNLPGLGMIDHVPAVRAISAGFGTLTEAFQSLSITPQHTG